LKTFVSYHAHEISSGFKVLKSRKEMKVSVFEALTYFGSSNTRNYKKAFNKMHGKSLKKSLFKVLSFLAAL
jgi:uncharacterized BrkB/YihY/UPF0761 family membrane protein